MNLPFLRRTLACALLAALPPVMAATAKPVPAPPPPTPPSALMVALQAVSTELQTAVGGDMSDILVHFERFEKFHFSAPTQAKLAKVFGDTTPASFERVPASAGARAYRFTLNPFSYTDPNGTSASWTTLLMDATIAKGGREVQLQGQWPTLDIGDAIMRGRLRGMRFTSQQRRVANDVWVGPGHATINSASIEGVAMPFAVRFNDIAIDADVNAHGKLIDVKYAYSVARIEVDGQQIDGLRAAMRLINLDYATTKALSKLGPGKDGNALTPQQQLALLKPMLQALARSAVKNGTAIVFDDISASFHGHKASLSGRLALPEAKEGDLDSIGAVMAKLAGHIDVRVPVALVREVSLITASKPQNGAPAPSPEAAAQMAEAITDGIVGKLLNSGYARLEDGVLVSRIELKNGVVLANGKPIDFGPKAPPNPPLPVGQAPRAPAPVRARPPATTPSPTTTPPATPPAAASAGQQTASASAACIPPPVPPEAIRQHLTLETVTTLTVGADGHARDVRLTQSSGWPDYDATVIEAARNCVWQPALVNGKPVDSSITQRSATKTEMAAPRAAAQQ